MKTSNVLESLKKGNITIPAFLLSNYKNLKMSSEELILIMYLMNQNDIIVFDVNKIAIDTNDSIQNTLTLINSLIDKKMLNLKVIKNKDNIAEEFIGLELFYNKLTSILINDNSSSKDASLNIFDKFEKEFGRSLSPIEYELINSWIEDNNSEEMIASALKEAILNNVHNLKYIDKILFDWHKKGYKKPSDIKKITKKELSTEKKEMFEYDWLTESDEK